MKKTLLVIALMWSITSFSAGPSEAALVGVELGLPDILSDQTGTYTYTWNSSENRGFFHAKATPLAITFNGTSSLPIGDADDHGKSYEVSFYVDGDGNFDAGSAGNDLEIWGSVTNGATTYNGLLIAGDISRFGWLDVPGPTALFDFEFTIEGGQLFDFFLLGLGGDITFAENSDFAGNWRESHEGLKVKHDTAPIVPIPGTAILLGCGLAGIVAVRRKFRQ